RRCACSAARTGGRLARCVACTPGTGSRSPANRSRRHRGTACAPGPDLDLGRVEMADVDRRTWRVRARRGAMAGPGPRLALSLAAATARGLGREVDLLA